MTIFRETTLNINYTEVQLSKVHKHFSSYKISLHVYLIVCIQIYLDYLLSELIKFFLISSSI
jgi:hypothetical protein